MDRGTKPVPVTVIGVPLLLIAADVGETKDTVGAGYASDRIDVPDLVLSDWLVALTFTDAGVGNVAGAEYSPAAEIVPTVLLPDATPLTSQFTAEL